MVDYHDAAGWKLNNLQKKNREFFKRHEIERIEREIQEEREAMTPEEREAEDKHIKEQYNKLVDKLKTDGIWREDE